MTRALRHDGVLPQVKKGDAFEEVTPDVVRSVRDDAGRPIDIVVEGSTGADPDADAAKLTALADAGATWWIEGMWSADDKAVHARITAGPPALG